MQTTKLSLFIPLFALLGSLGCSFYARSPAEYSEETTKLLETKRDELKSCYDEVLEKNSKAKGVVAVDFLVEAKTGAIKDATIDQEKTTAPDSLQKCVLTVIDGLKLDPPDQREGKASFSYNFETGQLQTD